MASKTLGLLMGAGLLLGACATAPHRGPRRHARPQTVQGEVVLADGKAVANMGVALRCGDETLRTRSDAYGRFLLRNVKLGSGCQAWLDHRGKTHPRAQWAVNSASNLLRARRVLRFEVKPSHRLSTELLGPKNERLALVVDEAHDDPRGLHPWAQMEKFEHRHPIMGQLVFRLGKSEGRMVLRSVEPLLKGWRVTRSKLTRQATLPPLLRPAPRDHDRLRLELLRRGRVHRLEKLAGERSVIWVGRCAQLKTALERDLAGLESSRGLWGLRTLVVLTDGCDAARRPVDENVAPVYRGGAAARWAFGASPSATLLVMERDGVVPWRRVVAEQVSGVGQAMSYLRRSWPVFAAAERVSVESSATVSQATVTRLLGQADALARRGETKAASGLFDRVLRLSPKHAEAHRRRALLKAAQGDLGGAMSDVLWWRDTYGDDSADELLDQVRRSSPAGASLR